MLPGYMALASQKSCGSRENRMQQVITYKLANLKSDAKCALGFGMTTHGTH